MTKYRKPIAGILAMLLVAILVPFVPSAASAEEQPSFRHAVDRENPIMIMNHYYNEPASVAVQWAQIPADVKDYTALMLVPPNHIQDGPSTRSWIETRVAECQSAGAQCIVQIVNGETGADHVVPISWLDDLSNTYSKLIGFHAAELYNSIPWYGEAGGNQSSYLADLIDLAAEHGMYFFWTDTNIRGTSNGTILDWIQGNPDLIAALRAHKDNVVMMQKQSNGAPNTDGLFLGLWLAGLIGNWGTATDWWHWQIDGNGKLFTRGAVVAGAWKQVLTYPEAMYGMDALRVASSGGVAFAPEANFNSMVGSGVQTATYRHVLLPLFRKMISQDVPIPSHADVLAKTEMAYQGRLAYAPPYTSQHSNLYPNSGRYGITPLLPTNLTPTELASFPVVETAPKGIEYFESLYPSETLFSDTFALRNGKTWYWMNSSEDTNINQKSVLKPQTNSSGYFSIDAGPHTYAAITESATGFDVHLNNYRVDKDPLYDGTSWEHDQTRNWLATTAANPNDNALRTTVIKVNGDDDGGQPALTINGDNGFTYTEAFDTATAEYVLTINHNGPIDFEIDAAAPDDPAAPAVPNGLTGMVTETDQVDITWDLIPGATGYDLEIDGDEENPIVNASMPYPHRDLVTNSSHSYRVRATNAGGTSAWSSAYDLTFAPTGTITTVPKMPTGFTATATSTNSVTLSWDPSYGATLYELYVDGVVTSTAATSYTQSVGPHSMHLYAIRVKNAAGKSDWSDYINVQTPEPPKVPQGFEAEATATASSYFPTQNQAYKPSSAIDGVVGFNGFGEWASNGGSAPWIKLAWDTSRTINKIVLYDRVNSSDWMQSGTLSFSDGTFVNVAGIPNNGTAKEITFPDKTVTWAKFQATNSTAGATGLAEFQAFHVDAPTVTASTAYPGYPAANAVDGIVGQHAVGEWASNNESSPWIKFAFPATRTINKIVLFDRPNLTNWTKGGTLTFSDGSAPIQVAGIPNDGSAREVVFPDKTLDWVRFDVTDAGAGANGLSEVQLYRTSLQGTSNLALPATTTASASSDYNATFAAAKAKDASTGTSWAPLSATGENEWLELNFGAAKSFNQVVLKENLNRTTGHKVQYYDGTNWVDIVTGTTIAPSKSHTFATVSAQRVRLLVTTTQSASGGRQPNISEFEVSELAETPQVVNQSPSATATGSSEYNASYAAGNAKDGSLSTRWSPLSTTGVGEWLEMDLGSAKFIHKVVLSEHLNRMAGYKVQYFNGTSWIDIVTGTTIAGSKSHAFDRVSAQKVRLLITATQTDSNGWGRQPNISEFQVYGF
ncbi:UNVERIFIED_CONTAM: discoidin domain-containing protein [Microbacterium sp. SLM126]